MKYHGEWKSRDDMLSDVEWPAKDLPTEDQIVYAVYDRDGYEGYATLIWVKDGVWYENHDSHCSCYGLEGWSPEETTKEALLIRDDKELVEAVRAYAL